jgi:CubicO group peptidase (beta-lactamase class C family)
MQQWELKKFDLDSDVNSHLPFSVRNPAYPGVALTFRQLLTHRSSIADGPAYEKSYACGDSRVALGQWLRDYLTAKGALYDSGRNFHQWRPGMQFAYSNVAYGLLGHLVETLSGMSYSDYMLKRIFAPLGMSQSRILLAGMNAQSHATPYTYASDGNVAAAELRDPAWTPPAGRAGGVQAPHCLYSFGTPPDGLARTSALELSRFLRAFINNGELEGQRVLQSNTVAQILSGQGLTWRQFGDLGPGVAWGHNGGDPGVSTLAVFRPQDRRGVVILTNSGGGGTTASQIVQRVLGS